MCDTGSGLVKAGLASDEYPWLVMPTLVGRPVVRDHAKYSRHVLQDENAMDEYLLLDPRAGDQKPHPAGVSEAMVGKHARDNQSFLDISSPMRGGVVKNWTDMELVWQRVFEQLKNRDDTTAGVLTPSNKNRRNRADGADAGPMSVVLTESCVEMGSKQQREKTAELMFESFDFGRINVSASPALVLAARGTTTGLVVDCGDSACEVVPVAHGLVQRGSIRRVKIGGHQVTDRLIDLLKWSDGSNYRLDRERDFHLIERVKERYCYVASDVGEERYVADKTNCVSMSVALPDKTLVMNKERFLAPEILFQPHFMGDASSDSLGVSGLISDAVAGSPIDLRSGFYNSIILTGGTSLTRGFGERLRADLRSNSPYIDESPDRLFLPFQGGAAMANLHQENDSPFWLARREYDEVGASAVHRLLESKC